MPAISVIVPVYKVEEYIHRCVDSILNQTFENFELILVDDGSPDNCPAICDEYAAQDSRICVIHQDNQGQAAARNHAAAIAKGDWVCFVDSDDLIHPQMLEFLYQAAIDQTANISMCSVLESALVSDTFLFKMDYAATAIHINESTLSELYDHGEHRPWIVCGKLIRKDIVLQIPFTEGKVYEDNAVVCQWLVKAGIVANLDDQLYFYRINPTGTTKRAFQIKHLDHLWALEEIISFFKKTEYHSLLRRFASAYLTNSASYYWRVKDELCSDDTARDIQINMRKFYRRNRKNIVLLENQKHFVYEVMFPRTMRVYWLYRVGVNTTKQGGFPVFIRKAFGFLRRGERK